MPRELSASSADSSDSDSSNVAPPDVSDPRVAARACAWKMDNVTRPFVVMRLCHEAIRVHLDELEHLLKERQFAELRLSWAKFERLIRLHMRQEDEVFFPLLDKEFEQAVEEANLRHEHDEDNAQREKLRGLIQAAADSEKKKGGRHDASELEASLSEFVKHHQGHLEHEEDVMMPKTQKLGDLAKRCAIVNSLISLDLDEFRNFMFPHVCEKLAAGRGPPMLANYLKGVRAATFYQEWMDLALIAWDVLPAKVRDNPEHPAMEILLPCIPEDELKVKSVEKATTPSDALDALDPVALRAGLEAIGLDIEALLAIGQKKSSSKSGRSSKSRHSKDASGSTRSRSSGTRGSHSHRSSRTKK
jgi:iron-sulfur cluster repair protein YtfE (RIC family)